MMKFCLVYYVRIMKLKSKKLYKGKTCFLRRSHTYVKSKRSFILHEIMATHDLALVQHVLMQYQFMFTKPNLCVALRFLKLLKFKANK